MQPKGTGGGGVKVQTGKGQVDRQVAVQHACGTAGGAAQDGQGAAVTERSARAARSSVCRFGPAATTSTAV